MHAPATAARTITPDTMIPDLLSRHPGTRAVLDRYGLRGCGGPRGPVESVSFFARTHGVAEERLLAEIERVIAEGGSPEEGRYELPSVADTIYRRYFTAGILAVLTAGATWGAWLLWKIASAGAFTSVSIHDVNAHGHAQVFGWVGLFIMGFAYQAFPRLWHTTLAAPRAAVAAFAMMVCGLVLRTAGMTLAESGGWAVAGAVAGGLLETAAVTMFALQIAVTFRRSGARFEPYVGFVFVALGWFVIQSVFSLWHTWNTMTASSTEALLGYVATYQSPLRDLQIHGLALFMILGVSIRMLPALFGVPATGERRAWCALGVLTFAVVSEVSIFIAYRWSGDHALAGLLMIPWLLLAAGVATMALPWRLWRPFPEPERSGKFVRAAYAWLVVSLVMLLLVPVHRALSGMPFSHAYHGAMRHAITVGFVSMMIMGFGARVVPTLNGVDTRRLTRLWGPFLLVNTGCFLRVVTQALTDRDPAFFRVVGVSGVLEVAGLAWWGAGLVWIMARGRRQAAKAQEEQSAPAPPPGPVGGEHLVGDVLRWFPSTEEVFIRHGFHLLKNPLLRRTVASRVSIAQACALRGVPREELLRDLNAAARPNLVPLESVVVLRKDGAQAKCGEVDGKARAEVR